MNDTKDSLGDRMKRQYEDRTRYFLPRRTFTILRIDGKAFHAYTRECQKPYDPVIVQAMEAAAVHLCAEVQGAVFAYIQSDEISVLMSDFGTIGTEAWFDGNLQKIVSVSASMATMAFNNSVGYKTWAILGPTALFDARAFIVPDPIEVENYFIWRQQDATRNSIQMLAQTKFSHKELQGISNQMAQEMLFTHHGINWHDRPIGDKRGRCVIRGENSGWIVDDQIPVFTVDRAYLQARIPKRMD